MKLLSPLPSLTLLSSLTSLSAALLLVCSQVTLSAENSDGSITENVTFADVLSQPFRAPDHSYFYGEGEFQFGQLWLPNADLTSSPRATLVFLHGGCWLNQFDISYTAAVSSALADEGYAVWSLEYRRTGDVGGGWPGTFDDVIAGINYLFEVSEQQEKVTIEKIALMGHSAGGHLAVLAGTEGKLNREIEISVELVIGLAAITDVISYSQGSSSCESATSSFMGGSFSEKEQGYRDANPFNHTLHKNTVLLQGDIDAIVPTSQAELSGANSRITVGAGHFDWSHPGTSAFADLLELLDEYF